MDDVTTAWLTIAFMIVLYLAFNIFGTVMYTKLKKDSNKSAGLVTVILGWLFLPVLNITSPLLYLQEQSD